MAQTELRFDLPEEVVSLLGPTQEAAALTAKRSVVVELVRAERISHSKAAEVLGVSRHDLIDLLAEHDVPAGPTTIEEYRRDVQNGAQYLQTGGPRV